MKRGLGSDDCNWWCRNKGKVKKALQAIGGAITAVNPIAGALVLLAIDSINFRGGGIAFDENYEPTPQEVIWLEKWNDKSFIPFLKKIEALIIGTNLDKNQALILMGIYETSLKNRLEANAFISQLSIEANIKLVALVVSVFEDIKKTLTIQPTYKNNISTSSYLGQMSEVASDLAFAPKTVDILLFTTSTKVVDVNLNLPHTNNPVKGAIDSADTFLSHDPNRSTKTPTNTNTGNNNNNQSETKKGIGTFGKVAIISVALFGFGKLVKSIN